MENRRAGFPSHRAAVLSTVISEVEKQLTDASSVFIDNAKNIIAV